jgi:hypothetical protein
MRNLITIVTIVCFLLVASTAAIAGPPTAILDKDKLAARVGYSSSTEPLKGKTNTTTRLLNKWTGLYGEESLLSTNKAIDKIDKEFENNKFTMDLIYGITRDIDAFIRIGMSRVDPKDQGAEDSSIAGGGLTATLHADENSPLEYGMSFKYEGGSWNGNLTPISETVLWEYDNAPSDTSQLPFNGNWKLRGYEIDVDFGATYNFSDKLAIYGGPYWRYTNYHLDISASASSSAPKSDATLDVDVDTKASIESSKFSGYIGANAEIFKNTELNVEFRGASKMWFISLLYEF